MGQENNNNPKEIVIKESHTEKFSHKSKYSSRDSSELLLFCNIGYCGIQQIQANKALCSWITTGTSTCAAASLNSSKYLLKFLTLVHDQTHSQYQWGVVAAAGGKGAGLQKSQESDKVLTIYKNNLQSVQGSAERNT